MGTRIVLLLYIRHENMLKYGQTIREVVGTRILLQYTNMVKICMSFKGT